MLKNYPLENFKMQPESRGECALGDTTRPQKEIERELNCFDEVLKQIEGNVRSLSERLSPLINNSKDNCAVEETPNEIVCELANQIKIKRQAVEIINYKIANLLKEIEL